MIIGHTLTYTNLKSAIKMQSHHAFLLTGKMGIGKATIAKSVAITNLTTFSQQRTEVIEKQCLSGAYPNYIYITKLADEDGKTKNDITVEQIRILLNNIKFKAAYDAPRFVIIDAIDDLNRTSSNALLKALEEPPLNTIFLLVCHQLGKLLPTIRSRCLMLSFDSLSETALSQIIGKSGFVLDCDVSKLASGSAGQYLKIQQAGGIELIKSIEKLLKITNLSDLKTLTQEILKNTDDDFTLKILHQILYQKALHNPDTYSSSAQAVERFVRHTYGTYIDGMQRIIAAVLLAQNPNQQDYR